MEEIKFEEKIYKNIKGKWYDDFFIEVNMPLQNKLNSSYLETINLEKMSVKELLETADGFKKTLSNNKAIEIYNIAIEKTEDIEEIIFILPRITSSYRLSHKPEEAVELYKEIIKKYGYDILNSVLLTSIAAAYCDIMEYANARKCADKAYAMSKGNASDELRAVYGRIRKETNDKF